MSAVCTWQASSLTKDTGYEKDTNQENGAFAQPAAAAALLENNCSMTLAMQVIGANGNCCC